MTNPCAKDCPDRSPTCHGSCERYAAFAAYREQIRQNRYSENQIISAVFEAVHRCSKHTVRVNQQSIRTSD